MMANTLKSDQHGVVDALLDGRRFSFDLVRLDLLISAVMIMMTRSAAIATAAAEPTWPVLKARLYASKAGSVVLVPGPPRVVM